MNTIELIKLILPLIVLQMGLIIYALVDLRKNGVRNLNKLTWIVIIILVNSLGPILFLIFGRGDGHNVED